jgi:hypothetical protein
MNILETDCRLEPRMARKFTRAIHVPTGSVVEFYKPIGKREILKALGRYVVERQQSRGGLALSSQNGASHD